MTCQVSDEPFPDWQRVADVWRSQGGPAFPHCAQVAEGFPSSSESGAMEGVTASLDVGTCIWQRHGWASWQEFLAQTTECDTNFKKKKKTSAKIKIEKNKEIMGKPFFGT